MRDGCLTFHVTAVVVLLSGVFCLGSAQSQNLVKNGDMSLVAAKTGLPTSWLRPTWSTTDPLVKFGVDSTTFHSAAPSLKLTSSGVTKDGSRMIGQQILPIPKGKTIRVSAWVKDEGVAHAGFDLAIQAGRIVNGAFKDFGWIKVYSVGVSPNDWMEVRKDVYIDSTATSLYVYAGIWDWSPTGTAWVDDVVITCPDCPNEVLFRLGSGQRSSGVAWKDGVVSFAQTTSYRLSVLDAGGRTVASSAGHGRTLTVDKTPLAAGTYLVRVNSLLGVVDGKLVVGR